PAADVRAALERPVALRPDLDDALYRLALMDGNQSRPAEAVRRLRAMRPPAPDRAWRYYSTLATALLELGDRGGANRAAVEARNHVVSDDDRSRAAQLVYFVNTELSVEIAADAQGRRHFRTVRVPVNAPPRNPFIEAGDEAHTAQGKLDRVECADRGIRVLV